MRGDRADKWAQTMKARQFHAECQEPDGQIETIVGKPFLVTNDPARAVVGCDIIIMTVPALAHRGYLDAIKPHVLQGTVLVGLPGVYHVYRYFSRKNFQLHSNWEIS